MVKFKSLTMYTCPNCGSPVLEGDPYCQHCGSHLSWIGQTDDFESNDYDLDDVLDALFINQMQKSLLKQKLESYLRAKDVRKLFVRQANNEYAFHITRQNRYVKTVDEFYYDPKYVNPTQVFAECITNHTHDGLKSDPRFKALIKSMDYPLHRISGGYVTEYSSWPREFRLIDRIEISLHFRIGEKIRTYRLDIERMKLDENYYEFEY